MDSPTKLEVLFEDIHCLVVNKPARLLTASDKTGDSTLYQLVMNYRSETAREGTKGYIAPLHFLDRPVSGIVIYAKSSKAASRLSEQFRNRKIHKFYEAIVHGPVPNKRILLEDWLVKDKEANLTSVGRSKDPDAKVCRLTRSLIRSGKNLSWVQVEPETGRSHQIRVQLSHAGNAIYGDRKYGAESNLGGQILLHARKLIFEHPVSKEKVEVTCPVGDIWQEIWERQ